MSQQSVIANTPANGNVELTFHSNFRGRDIYIGKPIVDESTRTVVSAIVPPTRTYKLLSLVYTHVLSPHLNSLCGVDEEAYVGVPLRNTKLAVPIETSADITISLIGFKYSEDEKL